MMQIRLGYVANALRVQNSSPSRTITLHNINKIQGYTNQVNRLTRIAQDNLQNTLRILKANYYDGIQVYRMTSKLVPLCTHPQFSVWDFTKELEEYFAMVGEFANQHKMRISMHPDHFTLLNSIREDVIEASITDLDYHVRVIEAMHLNDETKLVIHVGGKYEDKNQAIDRFRHNFQALPERIKNRLVLENDDRCFNAGEVLSLCRDLSIPMVLDLHHHRILHYGIELEALLKDVFQTWGISRPKLHLSSPRSAGNPRAHADFIDVQDAIELFSIAVIANQDFDLMLEAKQKDLALFKFAHDLTKLGYDLPGKGEIFL